MKFASMVVLFWGESLIWFWGRHFFVQGVGGVAAVPFLNETAVAMQYNSPP